MINSDSLSGVVITAPLFPPNTWLVVLSLLACAMGSAGGIEAVAVGRLADVKHISWVGYVLALYSVVVVPASVLLGLGLVFGVAQLVILGVAMTWFTVRLRRVIGGLIAGSNALREREEEMRQVKQTLSRAAERDHELRAGLTGLVGATHMLSGRDTTERAALSRAVEFELARLGALLARPIQEPSRKIHQYNVRAVVHDQVVLRRATGMNIELDADPTIQANGSPQVLAQVMANLLTNCDKHAPGSPVHVRVALARETVDVHVSDLGPAAPAGTDRSMFDREGQRLPGGGPGLGLQICRELLTREGGTIEVSPRPAGNMGFRVTVHLPTADRPPPSIHG